MSLAHLAEQLSQLTESLKQTNALISRLSKLSFRPGSEPIDTSNEDSVRVELAQDIHDSLRQLEEDFELLKQEAEDLTTLPATHKRRDSERDRERTRLSAQVARLGEDLRHCRGKFGKAQLSAKRASEEARRKEREVVFANLTAPPPEPVGGDGGSGTATPDLFAGRSQRQKQKQLGKDEQLVAASGDVTAALRRTHNLLSTELSRSRFAQETFDESTAALAELGEHYTGLDTILTNSRNLLGTLLRSQKSDTWYLETAFYLLCATLAWLFFRRVLFGPFVKLPLFLWNVGAVLLRWVVLKPLWLLLTLSGIITTEPQGRAAAAARREAVTSSRAPLVVQRSATGGIPTLAMSDREALRSGAGVPAGAGGAGAKVGKNGEAEEKVSESEKIGQMHAESEKQKRGDGTVLQDRGEVPRNPKKKAFDVEAEDERQREREKDEL